MLVFGARSGGGLRAKRADLSTGYPQALRASLRPRAKRAPPSYYSPHKKKEGLRGPLRAFYISLNKLFSSEARKSYPQVIHRLYILSDALKRSLSPQGSTLVL